MRIAAICPTFRRPGLIPGIVRMFLDQTHQDKFLLVLDDGQSFQEQWIQQDGEHLGRVISCPYRMPTVWDKFNFLWKTAEAHGADAVAVMEDDDLYLPGYLAAHAAVLNKWMWSASSAVWFNQKDEPSQYDTTAARRFHGGWAYTIKALREVDGYPTEPWGSDLTIGKRMTDSFGPAVDPWENKMPQYGYRWQTSGFPNAHGFGRDMHKALENTHQPATYEGLIDPQLDQRQAEGLGDIYRAAKEWGWA